MYKILLEARAERDLNSLDNSVKKRIIVKVLDLQQNPRKNSRKIVDSNNAWKIRIGDWRVIYEIYDKIKTVRIYRIKHRSKAYL